MKMKFGFLLVKIEMLTTNLRYSEKILKRGNIHIILALSMYWKVEKKDKNDNDVP